MNLQEMYDKKDALLNKQERVDTAIRVELSILWAVVLVAFVLLVI